MTKRAHMKVLSVKVPKRLWYAVQRAAALPPKQSPSSYVRALLKATHPRPAKP